MEEKKQPENVQLQEKTKKIRGRNFIEKAALDGLFIGSLTMLLSGIGVKFVEKPMEIIDEISSKAKEALESSNVEQKAENECEKIEEPYEYNIFINSVCNKVDEFFRNYLGQEYTPPQKLGINFCKKIENTFIGGRAYSNKKINLYIDTDKNLEPDVAELIHTIMHEYIHTLGRYSFYDGLNEGIADFLSFLITGTAKNVAYEHGIGAIAILWNSAWSGVSTDEDAKKFLEAYVEEDAAKWEKVIEQAADNYKLTGDDKKIFMDIYMEELPPTDVSDIDGIKSGLILSQIRLFKFAEIENMEEILKNNRDTIQYIMDELERSNGNSQIIIKTINKLITSHGELVKKYKQLSIASMSPLANYLITMLLSLLIRYFASRTKD